MAWVSHDGDQITSVLGRAMRATKAPSPPGKRQHGCRSDRSDAAAIAIVGIGRSHVLR